MINVFEKYWKYLATFTIGIFIGLMINLPYAQVDPVVEYMEVHDTISIPTERIIEHTSVKYIKDTTFIVDSVEIKGDTIYVTVPQEYKIYNLCIEFIFIIRRKINQITRYLFFYWNKFFSFI